MKTRSYWAVIIFITISFTGLSAYARSTEPGYIKSEVLTAKAELQDAQTEYARLRETKDMSNETQAVDRTPTEVNPKTEVTPPSEEKRSEERTVLRKI